MAYKAPRRTRECQHCKKPFTAKQDHGVWPRFCGRKCFCAFDHTHPPVYKQCPTCEGVFKAERQAREEDGLRKFCSRKCAVTGRYRGKLVQCLNCGVDIYERPSQPRILCSVACCKEYLVGALNASWKGGVHVCAKTGVAHLNLPRPGYVGRYATRSRVVASRAIGRLLMTHEIVLRINRVAVDDRPENLFICGKGKREFHKRWHGSWPWPTKSNLGTYR